MGMRTTPLRKPLPLVGAIVLLAAIAAVLLPVARPEPADLPLAPARSVSDREIEPSADPPRLRPAQVCVAADDSGSEFGPDGTDPDGQRYEAAGQLVDYLAGLVTPQGPHTVAVVRFGSTAEVALTLTAVTEDAAAGIRATLRPGQPRGNTDYPGAVRLCAQLLEGAPNPVIVVVGDGDPDLGDGRAPAELFADIAAAIADLRGIGVHVLLAIRDGLTGATAELWRATGVRAVTDVGAGERLRQRVAQELITVLGSTIGVLPRPLGTLDGANTSVPVDVPAYAPSLTLTGFAPAKPAALRLRDPGGTVVAERTGGIVDIPVAHPAPGRWQVELVDGGPVTVQVDIAPLQARLLSPAGEVPVGRPLAVSALVGAGPVASSSGPPLYVGAIVTAGGRDFELQLHQDGDGVWRSLDAAPIEQVGPVAVRLLLKVGADTVLDATTAQLAAVASPYLVPDPPMVIGGSGSGYGWQLRRAGGVATDAVLGEDPRAAVVVRVGGDPPQRAAYRGNGRWTVPESALAPSGPVRAELSSRLLDGTVVHDEVTSSPEVVAAAESVRAERAAVAGLLAVAVCGGAWLVWLLGTTGTRLDGHLQVPGRARVTDRPVRVRRCRWLRTGGGLRGRVVWLRRGQLVERQGLLPWPFDAFPSPLAVVPGRRSER